MICRLRRGDEDTDTYLGKERTTIHKPRRETSEETSPNDTLISDF